jgi:hypothetical protein
MRSLLLGLLVLGLVAIPGFSFGGTTEPESLPSARAPFPGLPTYISGYKRWAKHNRRPIPERASAPHGGPKNIYVNKPLRAGQKRYAVGTIIVKEAVDPAGKFPNVIAMMRKIKGFNKQHNDWQFIEWSRNSSGERFSELARGQVCYACHVGARSRDYVWFKPQR